jgi:hypothetical protein
MEDENSEAENEYAIEEAKKIRTRRQKRILRKRTTIGEHPGREKIKANVGQVEQTCLFYQTV